MYDAEYKKPYVATYKEIFIAFVVFTSIFIFLYPKDLLRKQVLLEDSNYDLSMLYLQNMLRNDPKNEELMFNLAKKSIDGSKRDLAYRLLKLLRNSKNEMIRTKAYLLSYKIAKEDYFYLLKDKKDTQAQALYKDLQEVNRYIVTHHLYRKEDLLQIYKETMFLDESEIGYRIIRDIVHLHPQNVAYLQSAYYLAQKLNFHEDALRYVDKLISLSKKEEKQKWKEAKYFLLYNYYPPKKLYQFLVKESKHSLLWSVKLAEFNFRQKHYKSSSRLYMRLFNSSNSYDEKLNYWIKAVSALQAARLYGDAARLGARYQDYFFHSKKARVFLLKLYLGTGKLKKAHLLAIKILKLKEGKR